MGPFTHLIFDLDGTLLDTIPELLFNLNKTFKELNLPGEFNAKEMASFIGSGKDEQIRRAMKARKIKATKFNEINALLSHYYAQNAIGRTKVFPGINDVLGRLQSANIKLYVATNKPHAIAQEVVTHFFGDTTFLLVRGDKGDGIVKPNPLFLSGMLKALKIDPESALFIGDSMIDYYAAKNAGLMCAIVPHGYDEAVLKIKDPRLLLLKNISDLLTLI